MNVSVETLRTYLVYTEWATSRVLGAARGLSAGEIDRDFGTADKSVLGTLTHVFSADRVWLARIQGAPQERPGRLELSELEAQWGDLYRRWHDWAAELDEAGAAERLSYRDLAGNAWVSPIWQIVLHVVNHGTHHRGQVAGFLRTMGKVPPPLDLIAFYRQSAS